MIKNGRQYRITKSQAEKFERALQEISRRSSQEADVDPLVQQAIVEGTESQLSELQEELAEYEALRSGGQPMLELDSFDELPRTLIRARIASGLTQKELGGRLGLKEPQIQRYEATEYASASLGRLQHVIR